MKIVLCSDHAGYSLKEQIKDWLNNKYEVLEEIFEDKYLKFRKLYWLLCDYSEYITTLECINTDKDLLRVVAGFNDTADVSSISESIISSIEEDNIDVIVDENTLTIEIEITETTTN